jgi:hypothetical protein
MLPHAADRQNTQIPDVIYIADCVLNLVGSLAIYLAAWQGRIAVVHGEWLYVGLLVTNSQPQILNPKPLIPTPENRKPETRNPKPETQNPKPHCCGAQKVAVLEAPGHRSYPSAQRKREGEREMERGGEEEREGGSERDRAKCVYTAGAPQAGERPA